MKNMLNEKLALLSTAQECMMDVADILEQLDNSQVFIEKSAYDSMNVSDKIVNLSKEGNQMLEKLQEHFNICNVTMGSAVSTVISREEAQKMNALLQEIYFLLHNILTDAARANEISHQIEAEAAHQREIEDNFRNSICGIREGIDSTAACAEFLLAEL